MPDTYFRDELVALLQTPGVSETALKAAVKNLAGVSDTFDVVTVSASVTIRAVPCKVRSIRCITAGTITLWKNSAASGTPLLNAKTFAVNEIVNFGDELCDLGVTSSAVSGSYALLVA